MKKRDEEECYEKNIFADFIIKHFNFMWKKRKNSWVWRNRRDIKVMDNYIKKEKTKLLQGKLLCDTMMEA